MVVFSGIEWLLFEIIKVQLICQYIYVLEIKGLCFLMKIVILLFCLGFFQKSRIQWSEVYILNGRRKVISVKYQQNIKLYFIVK